MIFADGAIIRADDLDLRGSVSRPDSQSSQQSTYPEPSSADARSLKEMEEDAIIRALHRWEGNRTRAAEELGISRRTLINKIAEYGLDI